MSNERYLYDLYVILNEPNDPPTPEEVTAIGKAISDFYDSNLLVSFTSIHEAMVHPANSGIGVQEIESIMASMEEVVTEEDWLTNKVLYFDRKKGCFA